MPSTKEIRDKTIKVRATEEELSALRERSDRPRLAEWLRELGLGQRKRRPIATADPALLRALSAHGALLNQIARRVNSQTTGIDAVLLLSELRSMEQALEQIRGIYDRQNP